MTEKQKTVAELELLLSCFQAATDDDRQTVWEILLPYLPIIVDI